MSFLAGACRGFSRLCGEGVQHAGQVFLPVMVHRDLPGGGKVMDWRPARSLRLGRCLLLVPCFILLPTKDKTGARSRVMASEFGWKVGQQVDQGPGREWDCAAGKSHSSVACMLVTSPALYSSTGQIVRATVYYLPKKPQPEAPPLALENLGDSVMLGSHHDF